jgi:hypothetical protein
MRYHLAILTAVTGLLVTGCGELSACSEIKKQSIEKRDIGKEFLSAAREGKVKSPLTVAEVQSLGAQYFTQGLKLITDNPQCFTEDEVKFAEKLLSP